MRKSFPTMLFAAAAALAVNGTLLHAQAASDREILSSEEGALLPPEEWSCDLYVEEYEDFLEAGNPPETWRFVGKRYRAVGDDEAYDWRQWLEWYEEADCPVGAYIAGGKNVGGTAGRNSAGGLFGDNLTGFAIVAGLLVTGLIAAGGGGDGSGGNNMSPG